MSTDAIKERIYSIDLLRGIVMMVMLLDHTRDYVHAGALQSDPTDLSKGDAFLFFTRWITHFCAPTFVFLSGVSIYLQRMYGKSDQSLARFLFTRGLWLIFLEFTVVRLGITFNLDYSFFGLAQVIWVIGVSMVVMAGLIFLPVRVVGAIGLAMILFHNLLDGIQVPPNIAFAGQPPPDLSQMLWVVLHQPGVVPFFGGASAAFVAYPLIPWIGVMAAGFAFGKIFEWEAPVRRKWLLIAGSAITILFFAIRAINVYGDPVSWTPQETPVFTLLSILNTTKYPPSLMFLMMTLGPSILFLGLTDGISGKALWQQIAINFGRVPMFFYILQFPVAHAFGLVLSLLSGKDVSYLFMNFPGNAAAAPAEHGFPLWVVYAAWILGLALLYPLCVWWGRLKQRHKHWILSYL